MKRLKDDGTGENTDRQIWRDGADVYAPSIHVTKNRTIGINVGGHVIVMPVEKWHRLGRLKIALEKILTDDPL